MESKKSKGKKKLYINIKHRHLPEKVMYYVFVLLTHHYTYDEHRPDEKYEYKRTGTVLYFSLKRQKK